MEQKLAEFRARRMGENTAKKDKSADPEPKKQKASHTTTSVDNPKQEELTENRTRNNDQRQDHSDWLLDSTLGRWLVSRQFVFTNLTLLKVLLWLVLLGLFAELEFGLPFFIISLFYWLYEGLRSPATREPGELSAYSVFNPDCQPLLGTLTAEQLEGEMGYRPMANR